MRSRRIWELRTDVLGFSIGGMVAQEITLQAPDLVRKLILVGTGLYRTFFQDTAATIGAWLDEKESKKA